MNYHIEQYLNNLMERNLSRNTIEAYKRDLEKFENFVRERNEDMLCVDVVTIMAYSQKLQKERKANSSIARNLVSVRNFYRFLIKKGIIKEEPTIAYEVPKVKQQIPQILTVEEVDRLLNVPNKNSLKGIRDKAMLELMYAAGLKVNELLNIKYHDVNLKFSYVKCRGTKDNERIIPMGSYAVNCIEEYFKVRSEINVHNSDYLFLNLQGNQMTRQGFWKLIKQYAKEAGIDKRINPCTLRHSFAVHLLQNGADIKSVQELLGHRDLAATQIYSQIVKKSKLAEVYKKTHPRA